MYVDHRQASKQNHLETVGQDQQRADHCDMNAVADQLLLGSLWYAFKVGPPVCHLMPHQLGTLLDRQELAQFH